MLVVPAVPAAQPTMNRAVINTHTFIETAYKRFPPIMMTKEKKIASLTPLQSAHLPKMGEKKKVPPLFTATAQPTNAFDSPNLIFEKNYVSKSCVH